MSDYDPDLQRRLRNSGMSNDAAVEVARQLKNSGGQVAVPRVTLMAGTSDGNSSWLQNDVPLTAVDIGTGYYTTFCNSGGPYLVGAGGSAGSAYATSSADILVGDFEIMVSNADATERFYAYMATSDLAMSAGVPHYFKGTDNGLASTITTTGSDLSMDSNGQVISAVGGVFWLNVMMQVKLA